MKILSIALILSLVGLAACSKPVNTVERAERVGQASVIDDKRILSDSTLADRLIARRVIESTVSGNLLKVQIDLYNQSRNRLNFNYSFDWYDVDGMLVQSPTRGWRRMSLMGRESNAISAVAPNPRAVDFVVKFARP